MGVSVGGGVVVFDSSEPGAVSGAKLALSVRFSLISLSVLTLSFFPSLQPEKR